METVNLEGVQDLVERRKLQDATVCSFLGGNFTQATPKNGPASRCIDQAACLNINYVNRCTARNASGVSYTYCQVCLLWDNSRNCRKRAGSETLSHVCAADMSFPVIPGDGLAPATGQTFKRNDWQGGLSAAFCQWVRWADGEASVPVRFTVKDGNNPCLESGTEPLSYTLNGLAATCQGPRTFGFSKDREAKPKPRAKPKPEAEPKPHPKPKPGAQSKDRKAEPEPLSKPKPEAQPKSRAGPQPQDWEAQPKP
ncbi:hypothetical protein HYH03_014532 [Edaphochlamys debaryana]|uniref:Uncharacterized protein n=1 Tax=Edaphochlamys debaryana TaxID=47281 RepID=A0A836BTH6_9CHLO|nr:hypothetical protein HYH03_014532 [Edaphochlamys debaryana]|eukprot:KAG2486849.1 hypothetical protein HYH03_014532 [Edaphochlamys debaryana]